MEEARVPIPIVGGIDDNTDPLALRPPNLATSENTRVIRGGTVSKRPGWGDILRSGSSIALVADGDDRVLVLDANGGGIVSGDGVSVDPSNAAPLPLQMDTFRVAPGRGYVHSVQVAASASYACVVWSQIGRVDAYDGAAPGVPELDSEVWAAILDEDLRLRWGPHRLSSDLRWLPRVEPVGDGQFAVFAVGLGPDQTAAPPFDAGQDPQLYALRYDLDTVPSSSGVFLGDLQAGHYGSGSAFRWQPYRIYDTTTTYDPASPATAGLCLVAMNHRPGTAPSVTRETRLVSFYSSAGTPTDVSRSVYQPHSVAIWVDVNTSTILIYDAAEEDVLYGSVGSLSSTAAPDLIEVATAATGVGTDTGYDYIIGPHPQNPHFYLDPDGDLFLNEVPVTLTGSGPATPSFGSAGTELLPLLYEPAVLGGQLLLAHGCGGNASPRLKIGASDVTLYYLDSNRGLAPTARLGETRHGDPGHPGYVWPTNSAANVSGACVGGQVATLGSSLLYPLAMQTKLQNPRGAFANPVYDDTAVPAIYSPSRGAYSGAGYYNDEQVVAVTRVRLSSQQHTVARYGDSSVIACGGVSLWSGDRGVILPAIPRPYLGGITTGSGTRAVTTASMGVDPTSTSGTGEVKFNGTWAVRCVLVGTTADGLQIRSPVSNRRLVTNEDEDTIPTNCHVFPIEPHPSTVAMLDAGIAIDVELYATNRGETTPDTPAFEAYGDVDDSTYTLVTRMPLQQDDDGYFVLDLMQDLCRYATDTLGWGIPTEIPPRRSLALYTVAGELEPLIPPASQIVAQAGEYMFLVPSEDPTELWYSKPLVAGRVPEWSPTLTTQVPPEAGRCLSLAATYDRLYLLCEQGVWELPAIGGPDSTGTGSFPPPRLTYRGAAVANHMGTVATPAGVFYVTSQGPRLIGQDGSLSEPGNAVADRFDWSTVVGAVYLDEADEVVWFAPAAAAVLSLRAGSWSTIDTLTASAGKLGETLVRVNQAGNLRAESASSTTDGAAYPLATVTTGWVDLGDQQAFKRFNEITLLGRLENTPTLGTLVVKIAYDYDDTVVDTFTWNWVDVPVSATNTFQLEVHPTVSKVDSMKITVTEGTTTVGQTTGNDALWTLAGIEARVRSKAGLTKRPSEGKK